MVVANNGQRTDSCFNQESCENALDLGLTGLEIVTANEGLVLLSKLNAARNEGVLRSSVDEGDALEDAADSEDGRRSNFRMALLDTLEEVVGSIVDSLDDLSISLGVCSPDNNNFVQAVFLLELVDIGADLLDVGPFIVAGDQVVGTSGLIRGDERRVVDRGKRLVLRELLSDLALNIIVQDLSTSHSGGQVERADIPTTKDKVVGMDHRKDLIQRGIDVIPIGINTQLHGGRLSDASIVIGLDQPIFCMEGKFVAVSSNGGSQSASIVASPANHHKSGSAHKSREKIPNTRNSSSCFEFILNLGRLDEEFSRLFRDNGIFINVFRENVIVVVFDVIGCDLYDGVTGNAGRGRRRRRCLVLSGRVLDRMWRHSGYSTVLMRSLWRGGRVLLTVEGVMR